MKTLISFLTVLLTFSFLSGQDLTENHPRFGFMKHELNPDVYRNLPAYAGNREIKHGMDSVYCYDWGCNEFDLVYKENYLYNDLGQNTQFYSFEWNSTTNQWDSQNKYEYTYDNYGLVDFLIKSVWDANTTSWELNMKQEYTYNEDHLMTAFSRFNWNISSSLWVPLWKYELSYNADGQEALIVRYTWDGSNELWIPDWKKEHVYDNEGREVLITTANWDFNNSQWVNHSKTENTYDTYGNNTLIIKYLWDANNDVWVNNQKSEITYNTEGQRTQIIFSSWDINSNTWGLLEKRTYTYDSFGNPDIEIDETWNANNNIWVNYRKTNYTFNNDYTVDDLLLPTFYSGIYPYHNMITASVQYYWNENINDWLGNEQEIFIYSEHHINGIQDMQASALKVYPNPATDVIYFDLNNSSATATVELFDVQGRKIISEQFTGSTRLSVGRLSKGLYIYQIQYENKTQTGKILIR